MVAEAEKIISEIQQIKEQYQKEVGSKRKPWPRSIAERIEKLFYLGASGPSIAKDCDIPYHTILNWKPRTKIKSSSFHALAVRAEPQNQLSTVTMGSSGAQLVLMLEGRFECSPALGGGDGHHIWSKFGNC